MQTAIMRPAAEPPRSMPATGKAPEIPSASVPDTLAALHVNPATGLTHGEVETSRKEHGYNEVAELIEHPVLKFLGRFWGPSAWMANRFSRPASAGIARCRAAWSVGIGETTLSSSA